MKACPFGIECDACRFCRSWIMTNDRGEQKVEDRCGLEVLMDEIPRIRGSVDGCQQASNEARNRAAEAINVVSVFVERIERAANIKRLIGE